MRDLHLCRRCGALWWSWIDRREGWRGIRYVGRSAVSIFAADTDLTRVVDWIGTDYREDVFRPVFELARMVIRRRPDGLRGGVDSILRQVSLLATPDSEIEAERLTMLFRVLELVIERVVLGDLRPEGPRDKPPRRWTDDEVSAEARRFAPGEEEGLARLARTHDVVRRLLWERRFGRGAKDPDHAVVAIHDASPIIGVVEGLPFEKVREGGRRGVFAAAVLETISSLVNRGLVPENDHAIWMSEEQWLVVRRAIDPVVRLAGSVRRLLDAEQRADAEGRARVEMAAVVVRRPIEMGARFTDLARAQLGGMAERLRDDVAARVVKEILDFERKAVEADARCRI